MVPPVKAARRLHLTLAEFDRILPRLLQRGFPKADPDIGNYDLKAIDAWLDGQMAVRTEQVARQSTHKLVMERLERLDQELTAKKALREARRKSRPSAGERNG
ncbi:hypothetical protein [Bosea sp. BK604]|uniref:hypothetical protein n=1 Tax=Bosea sp. BK604 TaxID=2512180 RepID=UPI0010534543|nr:hypothetical protein [Bosea sp. BK604]